MNPARPNRPSRGFTIIELMTVMAIAAILIVIAAPSFSEFLARRRVEGAMAELVTDLQYARSEAVARNAPVRLTFGAGCYVIHAASVSADTTSCAVTPSGADIKTVRLDGGRLFLKPESTLTHFEFDAVRGTAANDLTTPANGRVAVCIANASGTDCGSSARAWRLQAVLTLMGRVETCSPSGNGYLYGYSSNCS